MDDDLGVQEDLRPPKGFALLAAIFEGGIAVVAVGVGWLLGRDPLETFRWTAADAGWGILATVPPLVGLWLCLKCPLRPIAELIRMVDRVLLPLFRRCRWTELAVICLLAGLGEEMLFRGIVQRVVAEWIGGQPGVWLGLAAAAVLFGLAHRLTSTYAVLAGIIGLYLGWIWLISGNLLVPIAVHSLYDFIALTYLLWFRESRATPH
ncbi:MAG: CPBP family intramembrane metalloprotease [Pirellulales bacterium]|nr:CPBP family intramembrane metalloprotease [Pirellulales bacterium]